MRGTAATDSTHCGLELILYTAVSLGVAAVSSSLAVRHRWM